MVLTIDDIFVQHRKIRDMDGSFLFTMHEGLPRQGPGSTACTKKMSSLIFGLPENPVILDIGCGSGMQTIDLALLCKRSSYYRY